MNQIENDRPGYYNGEFVGESTQEPTAAEIFGYCPSGDDIVVGGTPLAYPPEGEDIPF